MPYICTVSVPVTLRTSQGGIAIAKGREVLGRRFQVEHLCGPAKKENGGTKNDSQKLHATLGDQPLVCASIQNACAALLLCFCYHDMIRTAVAMHACNLLFSVCVCVVFSDVVLAIRCCSGAQLSTQLQHNALQSHQMAMQAEFDCHRSLKEIACPPRAGSHAAGADPAEGLL